MGNSKGFIMTDRDIEILKNVSKYKFLLGRQIQTIGNFTSERACNKRLKKLIDNGFLQRKRVLYGLPALYYLTIKAKIVPEVRYYKYSLNPAEINHDIAVVDTMIYFCRHLGLAPSDFISESQLHSLDGFSNKKHRPDLVFTKEDKKCCIEVEFSEKAKARFKNNISDNFHNFDVQYWVVPKEAHKVKEMIKIENFPTSHILEWEVIKNDKGGTQQQ